MRAPRILLAVALCCMLAALLVWLSRKPSLDPLTSAHFTPEEIARSKDYARMRYGAGFLSLGLSLAVACVLGLTSSLGAWAERVSGGRWWLTTTILSAVLIVVPALITLPLGMYRGLVIERRFGVSTQSAAQYLSDVIKANGFQMVVTAIAAIGFYLIVRKLPSGWPFAAAGFLIAMTVVLVVVYPLVYEPLFNRFTPVDAATRDRIVALADKAGVTIDRVLVADASRRTTKLNAYVSGLGATKRVVLYDTLLASSPPAEVDLIVAHELGHVVHRDVLRGTLLACAGAAGFVALAWVLLGRPGVLGMIGASGPGDPKSLPFLALMLSVATLATLPVANGFSRSIEANADRFAVRLTDEAQVAVDTEVSLARRNIADLAPNPVIRWLFFTHPATMERIRIAREP